MCWGILPTHENSVLLGYQEFSQFKRSPNSTRFFKKTDVYVEFPDLKKSDGSDGKRRTVKCDTIQLRKGISC